MASFSQTDQDLENKLNEIYAPGRVERIINSEQLHAYYNNVVYHSYKLEKVDPQKLTGNSFPVLAKIEKRNPADHSMIEVSAESMIQEINNGSFNVLLLNLERDYNKNTTYILGDTNYLFTLYSHKAIAKK